MNFPRKEQLSNAIYHLTAKALAAWDKWQRRHPKSSRYLPQAVAACTALIAGCGFVWLLPYQTAKTDLHHLKQQEMSLKQTYIRHLPQAKRIGPLQAHKQRTEQILALLQQQLTGNGEQDAVMDEINSAGRARGLRFTMFKPEVKQKTTIRLSAIGSYEAITRFVGDIAQLPRIVILDPLTLQATNDNAGSTGNASAGLLNMQTTATAIQAEPPHRNRNETSQ
jgi:type IV pilus assembly protein PilO